MSRCQTIIEGRGQCTRSLGHEGSHYSHGMEHRREDEGMEAITDRKVIIERVDDTDERWRFRVTFIEDGEMVSQEHARNKDIAYGEWLDGVKE